MNIVVARTYQIIDGTSWDSETPSDLIKVLEAARITHQRLLVTWGDTGITTALGYIPNPSHSERGYVGRSGGTIKIPLLVHNTRSLGGMALGERWIVKVQKSRGNEILWSAPSIAQ